MTEQKEYVVSFKYTQQISPDDWQVITPSMKVTDDTTVKDIVAFYRKYLKVAVRISLNELE